MVQRMLVVLIVVFVLAPCSAHATTWTKRVIAADTLPDPLLDAAADGSAVLAWNRRVHGVVGRWVAVDARGRPGHVHALRAPTGEAAIDDLDVSPAGAAILCTASDHGPSALNVLRAATRRPGGAFGPARVVTTVAGELGGIACAIDDAGDAVATWSYTEPAGPVPQSPTSGGAVQVARFGADGSAVTVQTLRGAHAEIEDALIGAGGEAYVTFADTGQSYVSWLASSAHGTPFDAGFRIGAPQTEVATGLPGISASGAAVIPWHHGTAIHLTQVRPGQVTEIARLRDPLARGLSGPNVVLGADGHALVTWVASSSPTFGREGRVRAALLRPGSGVGAVRTLVALDSFFTETAALGSDGSGAVAWLQSDHTGLSRAQARVLRPDGSWGPVVSLSRRAREDFDPPFPAVAGAPGGHALAAWAEPAHGGEDFGDRRVVLARVATP